MIALAERLQPHWQQTMMTISVIGWGASFVLLLTIVTQIYRQWSRGSSEGVSPYLFMGQMLASLGFTIYSALQGDVVFIVTNALMLVSAIVGLVIVLIHRRRGAAHGTKPPAASWLTVDFLPR